MKKVYKIILILFFVLTTSCTQQGTKDTYTFYAMDTVISLTFYNVKESKDIAKEIENIYLTYENVSDDFQEGKKETNVYDLNLKREADVTKELKEMLEFSIDMFKDTKGYFNPFIGRLSHLWKDALEEGKLVEDRMIQDELSIMNETRLEFEGLHAKLIGEGNLDLGGVAKGYATSKAKKYLDSIDCHSYLLNAGSSNIVLGNKNGKEFTVGLQKATATGYFETLTIQEKAISTSSIKEQHVEIEGKLYSHLLNPMTGYPAMLYDTLSILGEDSKILDVYTTAGFAMKLEELKAFLEEKNLDFIVSKDNKTMYKSIGMDAYEKN
ncbi:MAG: FAD:protein FMN transferase [Roseburia sp.]|nr:FAD:protein FMN transferase [Anaeroplasma bactoclasticum]MCM1197240.1 FAD:protein FMN transferase [Roseburia sp.]MCM1556090.1 FAD:protein FMN transferase [Anaeroplasma bactoclasticum]